jgi:hypothetical protein
MVATWLYTHTHTYTYTYTHTHKKDDTAGIQNTESETLIGDEITIDNDKREEPNPRR